MSERNKMTETALHYRTCHLCEALCGLEIETRGREVIAIRGDKDDVFSRGHICPKATAIEDLQNDPDRLRRPLKRDGDGWVDVDWQDAFDDIAARLVSIRAEHGPDALAFYNGNPGAHNYGIVTHGAPLHRLLKTKNRYSATSVDQLPHMLAGLKLYGHQSMMPVPDLDRTDLWIILGGNPMASNGSIMTAPDVRGKIKAIKARGGRVVSIDPRLTETAKLGGEHHFIRPGTDAALLLAMIQVVFADGLANLRHLETVVSGVDALRTLVSDFTPEAVAGVTGVPASVIRELTHALSQTPKACLYGRMGVSVQRFGGLCNYLVQALNMLTGHLDTPGGLMFPTPAVDLMPRSNPGSFDRYRSRVDDLPEFSGELPAAALHKEIETPGEGQIRGLVVVAGNPVLSTPGGHKLDAALPKLDFMVSLDMYLTETSRHADYVLPPSGPLERDHFGLFFHALAIRNTVKYSHPTFEKPEGEKHDWEILGGLGEAVSKALDSNAPLGGTPVDFLKAMLARGKSGVRWEDLAAAPHGIDLGPLETRLPERLFTQDKTIDLGQSFYLSDIARAKEELLGSEPAGLRLIGRRHVRSNNSWMHNAQRLVKGPERCTAMMHPDTAQSLGVDDGARVSISSASGSIQIAVEITTDLMPGTVSVPHGWGHNHDGVSWQTAQAHAGVSANDVTDPGYYDMLSGNAAVNGVPVEVRAA